MHPMQTQILESALNMLARREHSKQELERKLLYKFREDTEVVTTVVKQLIVEDRQNDRRFAAAFLRNGLVKRHGKNRIVRELRQKGVTQDDVNWAFCSEPEVDWFALAKELKKIKFGAEIISDYKGKAKQFRYLQYRGFTFDEIKHATQSDIDN